MIDPITTCPVCLRHERPGITNSELRTLGATTDQMCPEHQKTVDEFNRALREVAQNTKGSFA